MLVIPERGEIWRAKSSGRLVKILTVDGYRSGYVKVKFQDKDQKELEFVTGTFTKYFEYMDKE